MADLRTLKKKRLLAPGVKKVVKLAKNIQETKITIDELKKRKTGEVFKATDEAITASIPQHIILEKVIDGYSREMRAITYFTVGTFTKKTVYVKKDLPLLDRPSPFVIKTAEEFKAFRVKNIKGQLNNLGMTIGFDPEIFAETKKGELIYAWEVIPKGNIKTQQNQNYPPQNCYPDGFAFEFNTPAGLTCLGWGADAIRFGLKAIYDAVVKHDGSAKLSGKTLVEVPYEVLAELPDKHVEFGCKPSFNAYGLEPKEELVGRNVPFRSTGGHIHFGVGTLQDEQVIEIVKTLDAALAVPCVSLFDGIDNPIRRQFYGMAGEYRKPPHGIEYRVLSGALIFSPPIFNMLVDYARRVACFGYNGFREVWKTSEEETIEAIMSCDAGLARKIMDKNKDLIMAILQSVYDVTKSEIAYNVMYKGMASAIKNPTDVVGNWNLGGGWTNHCDGPNMNWYSAHKTIAAGKMI